MVADTARFERVSADTSVRILPGDVVTFSAGDAWASTAVGPAMAVTDAPVANLVGTPLYPPLPTARSMDIGLGLSKFYYYTTSYSYYNIALGISSSPAWHSTRTVIRPGSPPRPSPSSPRSAWRATRPTAKSWPGLDPGDYVVIWDGASDVTLEDQPQNGVATDSPAPSIGSASIGSVAAWIATASRSSG